MIKMIYLALFTLLLAQAPAVEQQTVEHHSKSSLLYKAGTPATITGTVTHFEKIQIPGISMQVELLMVQTDKGLVSVLLGPERSLDQFNMKLDKGQTVEVTGSLLTTGNHSMVIAAEINQNGNIVKLRDKDTGEPILPVPQQPAPK